MILCPLFWHKYSVVGINNGVWNNPWLYGYWLAAAGVWIFVYIVATYCCKGGKLQNDEDHSKSTEKLLPTQSFKTSTPFHITSLPVQPKREKGEIPGSIIEKHIRGIDISYTYVQPRSSIKSMPPSRPSENEFTWDNEDIPWSSAERNSVDSFYSALDVSLLNFDLAEQNNDIQEETITETAEDLYPKSEIADDTTLCAGTSANSEEETVIEKTLLETVALKEKESLDELTGIPTQIDSAVTTLSHSADAIDLTSNDADQSSLENDSCVKRRFKDREIRPCWNAADIRKSSIKRNSTPNSDGKRKSKR